VPTLQTALRIHPPNNMKNEIEDTNLPNEEVNTPEDVEPEVGLPADPVEVEPIDDAEDEAEVLKQKNQDLYEQLKKAKGFERDKKTGKWVKKEKPAPEIKKEIEGTGDITKTELYSLVKANVPDEDVDEVVIYSRSHNITATEALKKPELKAILRTRKEYRKTAEAANVGASRVGTFKISDEDLLNKASKGDLPTDDAGIARLVELKAREKGTKQ